MTEPKFTKGPWRFLDTGPDWELVAGPENRPWFEAEFVIKGRGHGEAEISEPDKSLIAAAPELYELAEKQADFIAKVLRMEWTVLDVQRLCHEANRVLAKARGEGPDGEE